MVRISSLSLASLALAVASASAKTSLYLSPARNIAAPIGITPEEADRILSHHINTYASSQLGDESDIWAHVLHSNKVGSVEVDQRAVVERLFDGHQDEQNRLLVLMHGSAHDDVIPSHLSATHTVDSAPSSNSFDALFDSYMSTVSRTLKSSESALSHLTGTFIDGFSASIDWLTTTSHSTANKWSQQASEFKSSAFSKLEQELQSAEALLAKLESNNNKDDATTDLSLQPLRFSGLKDLESSYGADSAEYAKAKKWVQEAVEKVTALFKSRSEEQGRAASIAFVVTSDDEGVVPHLSKRSSELLAPFHKRQLSSGAALKPTKKPSSSPSPLPKNLAGTCFTSAKDLEKATNECSGHGKAVKTSKGGRPCYRCQCKATEVRKGKKVYWAGAACEKKDVSTEFVLLASSVLLLVMVSAGSVYFLYKQASEDLPGTLASVTISLK